MRMPKPLVRRQVREEKEELQAKELNKLIPEGIQELESDIQKLNSTGQPMPKSIRDHFESHLGCDFSHVRVHTDAKGAEMAHALNAQAFTTGQNIVFGAGEYAPDATTGKRLLAHELTHVIQQIRPTHRSSRNREASNTRLNVIHRAPQMISRWTSLGSWSWDHPIFRRRRRVLTVRVGTEREWRQALRNMDDYDEYSYYIQGFLRAIVDPQATTRRTDPVLSNFINTVRRRPNHEEIMNFMRALYTLGGDLDLPGNTPFEMAGLPLYILRDNLSQVIERYQSFVIQEFSQRGEVVPEAGVRGVAQQAGFQVRIAIIQNAGATAMKGVDQVSTANRMPEDTSDQRYAKEIARRDAFETVRNAARTMRYTLTEHNAEVAFNRSIAEGIFDTIWSTVPGGGALSSMAKEILKRGFTEMIRAASQSDDPSNQAERINAIFVQYVNQLVPNDLSTTDANGAINGFEAVRR